MKTDVLMRDGDDAASALAAPVTPLAEDSLAILVITLASRLNRGAAAYYQQHFEVGTPEFRVVMALGRTMGLNVGAIALAADVDKAAASRSLKLLQQRGLVQMEQTQTRGRAAIVHLTDEGRRFEQRMRRAAHQREQRFVGDLSAAEHAQVQALVRRLIGNVPQMNSEPASAGPSPDSTTMARAHGKARAAQPTTPSRRQAT